MFEYIKGNIAILTPTYVVVEAGGVGYFINISLTTYTLLSGRENITIFIHQVVREDFHALYGFQNKAERMIFRLLISVNGIGANTAIMMLSSYPPDELCSAITSENVSVLKSIKGIGAKTAQRIIIDLKDKIGKTEISEHFFAPKGNTFKSEALSALEMLGFSKRATEKIVDSILREEAELSVEQLIKKALKKL